MYRYTRVLKGALFALLFSLSALLPSYAAITADGPGSGVAGPRETVPEEGAQTEALWQDPASPIHWRWKWCTAMITQPEAAVSFR